jgi:positive phototaxis protein PixI
VANFVAAAATDQRVLSFRLTPDLSGMIATSHLNEILTLTAADIIPIAGTPAAIVGVYNWRGEVLWLMDIGYALKLPPIVYRHHPSAQYSAIVVNHTTGPIGLLVEQVVGMEWIDSAAIQRSPDRANASAFTAILPSLDTPSISGYWQSPQHNLQLEINLAALIQQLQD